MSKKELSYLLGEGVVSDYPEHLDWVLPDICKRLNKLLAPYNFTTSVQDLNYSSQTIDLIIEHEANRMTQTMDFGKISSFLELLRAILNRTNTFLLEKSARVLILGYQPLNRFNVTFRLLNSVDSSYLNDFPQQINDLSNMSIDSLGESIYGLKEVEDFSLMNLSKKVEGDFYLPIFDNSSRTELISIFESIAGLNPDNDILFEINNITSTEYVNVVFTDSTSRKEIMFGVRDYDCIGMELNKFKGLINSRYILLEPDEDSIQYTFCDELELAELKKHKLVREEYLK